MNRPGFPDRVSLRAPHRVRRSRGAAVVCLLTVVLLVVGLLPAAAAPTDAELRDQVKRAEQAQVELRRQLKDVERRRAQAAVRLQDATARVDSLEAELARMHDEEAALTREIEALEARANVAQAELAERLRALYRGAGTSVFTAVLGGDSITDLGTRTHYLSALSRHDNRRLEAAAASRRVLARRQSDLLAVQARTRELVAEAESAREELDARFAEATQMEQGVRVALADTLDEADALRAEVGRREESQRRAEAQAKAAEAARAAQERAWAEQQRRAKDAASRAAPAPRPGPRPAAAEPARAAAAPAAPVPKPAVSAPAPSRRDSAPAPASQPSTPASKPPAQPAESRRGETNAGGMACPQDHPRSFTDTWGAPRSGGRSHQGTDIFGARGGDVFAITSGVVKWTKNGSLSGLFLALSGDDGNEYWYIHLQDFVASAGQRVKAGELIAHNGDTGNARGKTPHIHFELHPGGGGAVNPYPLLKRVCG